MTCEFDIGDVIVKIGNTNKWIVSSANPNGRLYGLRAEDGTGYGCIFWAEAHLDWLKVGTLDYIAEKDSDSDGYYVDFFKLGERRRRFYVAASEAHNNMVKVDEWDFRKDKPKGVDGQEEKF